MAERKNPCDKKLFFPLALRLLVYFAAVTAPLFSSAIVAGYDSPGIAFWFLLVPSETVLWYLVSLTAPAIRNRVVQPQSSSRAPSSAFTADTRKPSRVGRKKLLLFLISASLFLPVALSAVPGFASLLPAAYIFIAAIIVFNLLVFMAGHTWLIFLEPAFVFFIFYRLLDFSRASESLRESSAATVPLFYLLLILSYLFLSLLLYASSGFRAFSDIKKEATLFFLVMVPLALAAALFIPADYIVNDFILNFRDEKALSGRGESSDSEKEGINLTGVPAERWGGRSRASGSGKQYAVMIVSSEEKELYSAWEYLSGFDQARGFVFPGEESRYQGSLSDYQLNSFKTLRFLETWKNNRLPEDEYRKRTEAFYLSAIPERVVPYLPAEIEPTIYLPEIYPFSYYSSIVSMISPVDTGVLSFFGPGSLSREEELLLEPYLEIPLTERHRKIFMDYLESEGISAKGEGHEKNGYGQKISKLLRSFSRFQYELGYEEDSSVEWIARFIQGEFPGDCTEFSNSAAILARLAGIPSRVVRGYLASQALQTPSHTEAIEVLKESIDIISDIPAENLLLVTTAHKHSWVQFYVPGFGWADFEATEFAIPPSGGDPNQAGIVIPVIRGISETEREFVFPWKTLVSVFLVVILLVALFLYLYKAFLFAFLAVKSKAPAEISFESRYRYILHRFFIAGFPLKERSMTPCEYGTLAPEFREFASLFTELYFRSVYTDREFFATVQSFEHEYFRLKKLTRPQGFTSFFRRLFSLRGVFYR